MLWVEGGHSVCQSIRIRIRPFRSSDAGSLARIFFAAIHEIALGHYSEEQVNAWAPSLPDSEQFVERSKDGRLLLLAVGDADEPLAYGDLEADGHIDHLFCRPDAAGTGVTSVLYDHIEAAAADRGLTRLYVKASEPARRFFLKKGFHVVGRRDFNLSGIPIHNFAMEKFVGR
jgi:putative acetyltransferase